MGQRDRAPGTKPLSTPAVDGNLARQDPHALPKRADQPVWQSWGRSQHRPHKPCSLWRRAAARGAQQVPPTRAHVAPGLPRTLPEPSCTSRFVLGELPATMRLVWTFHKAPPSGGRANCWPLVSPAAVGCSLWKSCYNTDDTDCSFSRMPGSNRGAWRAPVWRRAAGYYRNPHQTSRVVCYSVGLLASSHMASVWYTA